MYEVRRTLVQQQPNVRVFDTETGKPLTAVQIAEAMNQFETLKKELAQGHKLSGVGWIAKERKRQIQEEGWTAEHDDKWVGGELLKAANSYIWASLSLVLAKRTWPWDAEWFKPKSHLRNLVKAGALIAAEIDRLQRKEGD